MFNPRMLTVVLLVLVHLAIPVSVYADDNDGDMDELQQKLRDEWYLIRNDRKRNIKTWVKQEDGKRNRSFKAEAVLVGSMKSAVHLVLDCANYDKWYWEVVEGKCLKRLSPTSYHVYLVHRTPFNVPGRDLAALLKFVPQTETNTTLTRMALT